MWITFGGTCTDNCGLLNYRLSGLWLVGFPQWMPADPYMQGAMIYGAIITVALILLIGAWWAYSAPRGGHDRR